MPKVRNAIRFVEHIPDGWQVMRLGDVADVTFSTVDKKTLGGELPVELCNYTDVFYNRRIHPGMKFMPATAKPVECQRWTLRKGDVLFTKDSETPNEIGIPACVTQDMPDVLCGYHLGLARPQPDSVDSTFLTELLASPETARQFARIANGVTRFGLTLDATQSLSLLLPPLREQRRIAAVLDAIDDAIERTNDVIAATEQLRDALLHDLLSNGVSGWRFLALAEAPIEVIDGDRGEHYPKQHDFLDSGYCLFLNTGNVTTDGFNFSSCVFISYDREQQLKKGKLVRGDVVLTTRGTVGNSAHFDDTVPYEHIRVNSGMVILRASSIDLSPRYLYALVRSQTFLSQVHRLRIGSAQPQLSIRVMEKITLLLPPLPEQQTIAAMIETVDKTIARECDEHDVLQSLK